eukprot:4594318-Heterocapsa_arctica.AAC.1
MSKNRWKTTEPSKKGRALATITITMTPPSEDGTTRRRTSRSSKSLRSSTWCRSTTSGKTS